MKIFISRLTCTYDILEIKINLFISFVNQTPGSSGFRVRIKTGITPKLSSVPFLVTKAITPENVIKIRRHTFFRTPVDKQTKKTSSIANFSTGCHSLGLQPRQNCPLRQAFHLSVSKWGHGWSVSWAFFLPIISFMCPSVLNLRSGTWQTDRLTKRYRQRPSMHYPHPMGGGGHNNAIRCRNTTTALEFRTVFGSYSSSESELTNRMFSGLRSVCVNCMSCRTVQPCNTLCTKLQTYSPVHPPQLHKKYLDSGVDMGEYRYKGIYTLPKFPISEIFRLGLIAIISNSISNHLTYITIS